MDGAMLGCEQQFRTGLFLAQTYNLDKQWWHLISYLVALESQHIWLMLTIKLSNTWRDNAGLSKVQRS